MDRIEIYTDGASRGNPGKGGYGIVMKYGKHRKEIAQGFLKTTNNRMELLAVIVALEQIKNPDLPVIIYSDSKYVVDAINLNWIGGWIKKRFAKVKNPDLWKRLISILENKQVKFQWVKGHASNPENNRCDQLATMAADSGPHLRDEYYESQAQNSELF